MLGLEFSLSVLKCTMLELCSFRMMTQTAYLGLEHFVFQSPPQNTGGRRVDVLDMTVRVLLKPRAKAIN
jgi:hypothetical protein